MRYLLFFILLISSFKADATHLLGGNIGYQNLGADPFIPGNTRFNVVFDAYLDCGSPFWPNSFPEPSIVVGVFEGGLSATSLNFAEEFNMTIQDSGRIQPNLPNGCSFGAQNCIYLVRYVGQVSLPATSQGYHIIYDRCCRPGSILNIDNAGDEALTFQAYIPTDGTNILANNSPVFTDTLASFICTGDTIAVPNSAIDPDGDSLSYALVDPYDGLTEDGGFGNNPPAINNYGFAPWNPYPYPIPDITWAAGYSLTQIFGAGGFNTINQATGSTFFSAAAPGIYAAAVEIEEYRNGVLIGITRRNIQLLAVSCPANPPPSQDNSVPNPVSVNPTVFVLEEGQNVCFDMFYDDPNNDSLRLTSSGPVFDPAITSPPASILSPREGDGSVSTEFCWATQCGQASTQPYIYNVSVTDNGCPPKTFVESYQILVLPFNGPSFISGINQVCGGTDSITYSVANIPGASFQWNVTGGTIGQNNGSEITVDWSNGSVGTVSVTTTSQYGCVRGPIDLQIQIDSLNIDAGSDTTICVGDTVQLGGTPTAPGSATLQWSPSSSLSDSLASNPDAFPDTTTTYTLDVQDGAGCRNLTTVTVTVQEPLPNGLSDDYFVCPGDTLDLTLQNTAQAIWTPQATVSNPQNQDYKFFPSVNTQYGLEYTDTQGCRGTDSIDVTVNNDIPTDAGADTAICEGDTVVLGGNPTSGANVTYLWTGLNLVSTNQANPQAFPTSAGQYIVQTTNDTCSGIDTVFVSLRPNPAIATSADTIICIGDTAQLSVQATGTIQWTNGTSLTDDTITDPKAFPSTTTSYTVQVLGTNLCTSEDTVVVGVQPLPQADAGDTLVNACKLAPTLLGGAPTGPTGATYSWSPGTGLNSTTAANPTLVIDTNAFYRVTVTDTIGCTSTDSVRISVLRISPTSNDSACDGDTLFTSSLAINGVAPFTYTYVPGAGVVNPGDPGSPIIAGSASSYEIIVTDDLGCTDTAFVDFTVADQATADYDLAEAPGCKGVALTTDNLSSNANSYLWLYNNENQSTSENTEFLLPYDAIGEITLIASNTEGCNDTVSAQVGPFSFEAVFGIDLPNVFSPNGDGINDFFEIPSSSALVECIDLKVFNRWGMLMFESSGVYHSWNGRTFQGEPAEEGVYYYTVDVRGTVYKGSVSLIR